MVSVQFRISANQIQTEKLKISLSKPNDSETERKNSGLINEAANASMRELSHCEV